jgi:hypothetical protein
MAGFFVKHVINLINEVAKLISKYLSVNQCQLVFLFFTA